MKTLSPEFQIIQDYFDIQGAAQSHHSVALGIGDDCAVLTPSANKQLCISVDTSIADRHFPADAPAFDIAYRALNVALSDLAAMGATPLWFTLAISLNAFESEWLQSFSAGLFTAAHNANVTLIGGDTTKVPTTAPLSITVQVHGEIETGKALTRAAAQIGDNLYVTGNLGGAGAGLAVYQKRLQLNKGAEAVVLAAYLRPEPQLLTGMQLLNKANACIDISDGLLADLGHILRASNVGACIDLGKIPLSAPLRQHLPTNQALQLALGAGDDYQLCFSSALSPEELGLENVHLIGSIIEKNTLDFVNAPADFDVNNLNTGFDHFYETPV